MGHRNQTRPVAEAGERVLPCLRRREARSPLCGLFRNGSLSHRRRTRRCGLARDGADSLCIVTRNGTDGANHPGSAAESNTLLPAADALVVRVFAPGDKCWFDVAFETLVSLCRPSRYSSWAQEDRAL